MSGLHTVSRVGSLIGLRSVQHAGLASLATHPTRGLQASDSTSPYDRKKTDGGPTRKEIHQANHANKGTSAAHTNQTLDNESLDAAHTASEGDDESTYNQNQDFALHGPGSGGLDYPTGTPTSCGFLTEYIVQDGNSAADLLQGAQYDEVCCDKWTGSMAERCVSAGGEPTCEALERNAQIEYYTVCKFPPNTRVDWPRHEGGRKR